MIHLVAAAAMSLVARAGGGIDPTASAARKPDSGSPEPPDKPTNPIEAPHLPPGWSGDQVDSDIARRGGSGARVPAVPLGCFSDMNFVFKHTWDDFNQLDLPVFSPCDNDPASASVCRAFTPSAIGIDPFGSSAAPPADGYHGYYQPSQTLGMAMSLPRPLARPAARPVVGNVASVRDTATNFKSFLTNPGQENQDPASAAPYRRWDPLNHPGGANAQGGGSPRSPLLNQLRRPF